MDLGLILALAGGCDGKTIPFLEIFVGNMSCSVVSASLRRFPTPDEQGTPAGCTLFIGKGLLPGKRRSKFRRKVQGLTRFKTIGIVQEMSVEEIRQIGMSLPEDKSAELAGDLLCSVPAVLDDEDKGVAEALRRSQELDSDHSTGCSWEEIKTALGR